MSDEFFPTPNPHLPTPNCIGWLLAEARVALAANARTRDCPLRIVETAPPQCSPRGERAPGRKQKAHKPDHQPPETHYGEWRVLRCQLIETENLTGAGTRREIELVVAREQILTETSLPNT